MNRRDFLKSLLAIAGSSTLPSFDLDAAPKPLVDQLWATLQREPVTFYVSEYGALSIDPVEEYPSTRKELLDYEEIGSKAELLELAQNEGSIADLLECEHSDPSWFDDDEPIPEDWQEWLAIADESTIASLIRRVNLWINDTPDEHDYEIANLSGYSGRGNALRYFRDDFEYCEELNIVVVEGDCPGSSYFAAELRNNIDDANRVAADLSIPIRFAAQG